MTYHVIRWLPSLLLGLAGCAPPTRPAAVDLSLLQLASPAFRGPPNHVLVADAQSVAEFVRPLGPRLGLVEIRDPGQYAALRALSPGLAPCPDLTDGTVVGVVWWAGQPLDRRWPITVDRVRVEGGAGLLEVTVHPGSYLPIGVGFLETTYVRGLRQVQVVSVNGTELVLN